MYQINKTIMTASVSFKAQAISALNCYLIYGFPSPFSFWGFAHNLTLKLGLKLKDEAVLPVIHSYKNRMSNNCFHQLKSNTRQMNATITDIPRADIECTIIFQYEKNNELDITVQKIKDELKKYKFAGGTILQDSIQVKIHDEKNILLQIKKGSIFNEKKLDLNKGVEIEDFFNEISIVKGLNKGWITPTMLGYSLIEEPTERKNVRFGYKHAFAEPFIGAIQFTKFRKYGELKTTFNKNSWKLQTDKKIIQIKQGE